jgi:hypothetical protein
MLENNLPWIICLSKEGAGDKVYEVTQCSSKNCAEYELCAIEEDMINDVVRFMNPGKLVKRKSKRHISIAAITRL